MDTVTEANMAIAMARRGGLGIIHRYCSIEQQVAFIKRVKRAQNYIIEKPYHLLSSDTIGDTRDLMELHKIHSIVVTDSEGKFYGIITEKDLSFCENDDDLISQHCTPAKEVHFSSSDTSYDDAKALLVKYKKKRLVLFR